MSFPGLRATPLVLELDLTEPVLEVAPTDPLGQALARRRLALPDLLRRLQRASGDDRVVALVAKLGSDRLALATAQELRQAVLALRAGGTRTVAWAESLGEFSPANVSYYLATAFEELWLQPSGDVGLTGVALEVPFLRDALDKAGIEPEISQRYEYKNAANLFNERAFTAAHREATERLVTASADQLVRGIAQQRGLTEQQVRDLLDHGPLTAEEARAGGLIDRVGYRDEAYADVRARAGRSPQLRFLNRYAAKPATPGSPLRLLPGRRRPVVALVHGTGAVRLGRSGRSRLPGSGGTSMGSDTVGSALRAAAAADDVRAVVLRVNSPGGSYAASDAIWREVAQVRAVGKPVVVSMGDVAASGGYFVAMGSDAIVASPATVTGSIGVLGGKQVFDGLLSRLGVRVEAVSEGEHARFYSPRTSYSPSERDRLERWLDAVYEDFTAKVAAGRGLTRAQVHEVARGRVWTGADAQAHGLVDELGGLERAVEIAAARAGVRRGSPVELRTYPKVSPLERLRPPQSSEDPAAAAAGYLDGWGALAGVAAWLGLPAAGPLVLPGPWRVR
ncbi:MAG: signal peptide peptidase SppA [Actinomycetota bacterium]|nr:signal peptide peptidase SppA [Actinomycetota bacterium]